MNKKQIIEAVKALPRNERMNLIRELGQCAAIDADHYSSGRPSNDEAYDKLLAGPAPALQQRESKIMTGSTHVKAETAPVAQKAAPAVAPVPVKEGESAITDQKEPE